MFPLACFIFGIAITANYETPGGILRGDNHRVNIPESDPVARPSNNPVQDAEASSAIESQSQLGKGEKATNLHTTWKKATDKEGRSVPAPGQGLLTTAREVHAADITAATTGALLPKAVTPSVGPADVDLVPLAPYRVARVDPAHLDAAKSRRRRVTRRPRRRFHRLCTARSPHLATRAPQFESSIGEPGALGAGCAPFSVQPV